MFKQLRVTSKPWTQSGDSWHGGGGAGTAAGAEAGTEVTEPVGSEEIAGGEGEAESRSSGSGAGSCGKEGHFVVVYQLGLGVVVVVEGHGWKGFAFLPVMPQKHFIKSKDSDDCWCGHLLTMS